MAATGTVATGRTAYYYPGYAWYYPVLPFGYATFWWGGYPYYYYNNLYYTYNHGYNGYVVTDPPPAAGSARQHATFENPGGDDGSTVPDGAVTAAPPPISAGPGSAQAAPGPRCTSIPRNGQSEQQTSTDSTSATAGRSTRRALIRRVADRVRGNVADYRRAMTACLDARGYSAR